MEFSVEVLGERELLKAFRDVEGGVTDLRPAWSEVATAFYEIEQDAFQSDGHGTWPELSPAYAEMKHVEFPFMPTLRRTQSLYFALTRKGADSGVYEETETSLTLGASGKAGAYGRAHMTPQGGRPARPPINLREEDNRKLSKALGKYLAKLSSKAGFTQTGTGDLD